MVTWASLQMRGVYLQSKEPPTEIKRSIMNTSKKSGKRNWRWEKWRKLIVNSMKKTKKFLLTRKTSAQFQLIPVVTKWALTSNNNPEKLKWRRLKRRRLSHLKIIRNSLKKNLWIWKNCWRVRAKTQNNKVMSSICNSKIWKIRDKIMRSLLIRIMAVPSTRN